LSFRKKPLLGQRLNTAHPMVRGLVGGWVMNESGGDRIFDLANPANSGTFYEDFESPSWGSYSGGLVGVNFPSVSEVNGCAVHMDSNYPAYRLTGSELTIAIKTKVNSYIYGGNRIISKRTSAGGSDVYCLYISDGSGGLRMRINGTDHTATVPSDAYNNPVGLVATYKGNEYIKFYQNGKKLGNDVSNTKASIDDSTAPLCLATRYLEERYLNGWLEYAYIWDRVLTSSEIQSLHINPYQMIEDPYPIELFGYVAAGGELSIPVAMHHLTKNIGV